MKLGSHVKMSGNDMLLGSAKEAHSYGANTFMCYTGAPQNTRRKEISQLNIPLAWDYMTAHGMTDFVIHAPYLINLANTIKAETYSLAVDFLALELLRTEAMKSKLLILHPGAHVGAGTAAGINSIAQGLNDVLSQHSDVCIALETMSGKGTEIGACFEDLARIYDAVTHNERLRVCFDTCHVHDSGYDIVHDLNGVFEQFDRYVGLDQIAVFHINDSKNKRGARKDRHANIGFGDIGFCPLCTIVHHPDFTEVPKILETPYIPSPHHAKQSFAPYKYELEMLKQKSFQPDVLHNICQFA